jgi:hypothetical protein
MFPNNKHRHEQEGGVDRLSLQVISQDDSFDIHVNLSDNNLRSKLD